MLTAPLDLILFNLFTQTKVHKWLILEGAHNAPCRVPSSLHLGTSPDTVYFCWTSTFHIDFQPSLLAPTPVLMLLSKYMPL